MRFDAHVGIQRCPPRANQIFRFVREMKPGDLVLVSHREHPATYPNDLTCHAATVRAGNEVRRAHFGGKGRMGDALPTSGMAQPPYLRRRFPKAAQG